MSRRIEQWIESLGNRDEAHPRAMPNIVRERAQTWVVALEQRVREIEPAMQEAEARHAQANAVFDCAAVRLRTARSGTFVDGKRPVGIHSDRSDQADRGGYADDGKAVRLVAGVQLHVSSGARSWRLLMRGNSERMSRR